MRTRFDLPPRARSASSRGTAIIEAVVVTPLLIVLFGCLVDYGRALNDRAALTEASRVAARSAARLTGLTIDEVERVGREVAIQVLVAAGYDPSRYRAVARVVDLRIRDGRYTRAIEVTVTADAGLRPPFFLPRSGLGSSAASTFRLEYDEVRVEG